MIYLDNSATTIIPPEVRDAMLPHLGEQYGNASSVYALGAHARVVLEDARATIARHIGADAKEIVFTGSGTEANNAAIKGIILERHCSGTPFKAMAAVTSKAEHHAVLHPFEHLAKLGVKTHLLDVDRNAMVDLESLTQLPREVRLVSFMMVNNEVGSINDVKDLTRRVKQKNEKAIVHTDAVQALGKLRFDVRDLGVDMLSLSAHKIHGPKGIGALYIKSGLKLEPLMHGGAQERNRRAGTESLALAVGFARAVEIAERDLGGVTAHISSLKDHLIAQMRDIPEVVLNVDPMRSVASIVSLSFVPEVLATLDGEALLIRFDLEGIAVSNGSACTSGSMQPSHVLLAMGKSAEIAAKSIRVSFSRYNSVADVDAFVRVLKQIVAN